MAEVEDDLCNQVAALKEQLLSEQSHKDKLETSLTQQLIETRIEMGKEMRGGGGAGLVVSLLEYVFLSQLSCRD